jgi:Domain of unknown function (DU1801)
VDGVRPSISHGTFGDIVASAAPALRPVCLSLRREIVALHKGYIVAIWRNQRIASFGVGPRKMSEHYAYIAVYASHVNLGFYHGAALEDRAGLLKGTGKRLRHISFRDVSSTRRPAVAALLRMAIAERVRNTPTVNARVGKRQLRARTESKSRVKSILRRAA